MQALQMTKTARQTLLDRLDAKRGVGSARALARELGIAHTTLASIYAGVRPLSVPFLRAIRQTYPDLAPDIDAFLAEDDPTERAS